MDAALLVDRHLVLFEIVIGDCVCSSTRTIRSCDKLVLIGEAGRGNGVEAREKNPDRSCAAGAMAVERVVTQLIVVAVVAKGGRTLRKVAQIGFVLLVKTGRSAQPTGRREAWCLGRKQALPGGRGEPQSTGYA